MFNGTSSKRWNDFKQFHCVLEICYVLIGINKFVVENQVIEYYADQLIHIDHINLEYNFQYEEVQVESEQIINQNQLIEKQQENQNEFLKDLLEEISSDEASDEFHNYENQDDNNDNQKNFTQDDNSGNVESNEVNEESNEVNEESNEVNEESNEVNDESNEVNEVDRNGGNYYNNQKLKIEWVIVKNSKSYIKKDNYYYSSSDINLKIGETIKIINSEITYIRINGKLTKVVNIIEFRKSNYWSPINKKRAPKKIIGYSPPTKKTKII